MSWFFVVHCPGIVLVQLPFALSCSFIWWRCVVIGDGLVGSRHCRFKILGLVTAGCVSCDQTDDFRGRSRLLRVTELCRRFCERFRRVAFSFRLHGERSVTQKTSGSGSFDGAACSASCMLDSVLRRFILPLVFFSIFA